MRRRAAAALPCALLLAVAACGDDDTAEGSLAPGATPAGDITVFAAASLTDAFTEVGATFEAEYPATEVTFNFAASSALATQITEGAPADVFASANATQMDNVVGAGANDGDPQPFATNVLQIAVPPDNPGQVTGLEDFADAGLLIGLCAEEVPCGQFGREIWPGPGSRRRSTPTRPTCGPC